MHARGYHLICGIGGCDCVFKDLNSLDIHQADMHSRTISLRPPQKVEVETEQEETKKVPTVSAKQYERMNKNSKNEHFPTLTAAMREIGETNEAENPTLR